MSNDKTKALDTFTPDVFDKLGNAHAAEEGVTLTAADVTLLWAVAGAELGAAGERLEAWQKLLTEYDEALRSDRSGVQRAP